VLQSAVARRFLLAATLCMSARCTLGEDACDAVLDELRPLLASTLRAVADEWQLLPHAGWPSPCRTHASNLSGLTDVSRAFADGATVHAPDAV
jgi:hypothetical protein